MLNRYPYDCIKTVFLYIFSEWDLQEQLGRNPEIVLGDKYLEENHYVFKEGLNEPFSCDLPIDN